MEIENRVEIARRREEEMAQFAPLKTVVRRAHHRSIPPHCAMLPDAGVLSAFHLGFPLASCTDAAPILQSHQ